MKTITLTCLCTSLSLGTLPSLLAQTQAAPRTDTLRRELTVETDEDLTLSRRQPQDLSYRVSSPEVPEVRYTYLDAPLNYALRPTVSPLGALTAPTGLYARSQQRGYASLAAGPTFEARAAAGYRLVARPRDILDLYGRFRWYDLPIKQDYGTERPKDQGYEGNLGLDYQHRSDRGLLDLGLALTADRMNYYGRGLVRGTTNPDQITEASEPRRHTTGGKISAKYQTKEDASALWLYQLGATAGVGSASYSRIVQDQRLTEWSGNLTAGLSRRLSSDWRLGAEADFGYASLRGDRALTTESRQLRQQLNRLRLELAPYIQGGDAVNNFSWRGRAGLRIGLGDDSERSPFYLFPLIDAELNWGKTFALGLQTDSHLLRHDLTTLREDMPYLDPRYFAGRQERLSQALLTAQLTLQNSFTAKLSLGYRDHHGALGLRPELPALGGVALPETLVQSYTFAPYSFDYRETEVALALRYQWRGLFALYASGAYNSFTNHGALPVGRPDYTLSAGFELNSIPQFTLRAGYDYAAAPEVLDVAGSTTKLGETHLVHADALYRLTRQLSLTADVTAPLTSEANRWYGYRQRSLTALLGLQLTF